MDGHQVVQRAEIDGPLPYPTFERFQSVVDGLGPGPFELGSIPGSASTKDRVIAALKFFDLVTAGLEPTTLWRGLSKLAEPARRQELRRLLLVRCPWLEEFPRNAPYDSFVGTVGHHHPDVGTLELAARFLSRACAAYGVDLSLSMPKRGRRPHPPTLQALATEGWIVSGRQRYLETLFKMLESGRSDEGDLLNRIEIVLGLRNQPA